MTNKLRYIILLTCCVGLFTQCNPSEEQTVVNFTNLVFEDEFDGNTLNNAFWNFDIGTGTDATGDGWGNNELQFYTDRETNVKLEGGYLHIIARQESFGGSSYTSGRINTATRVEQEFGRIEARMQLPWGQGIWPAFWMLGFDIDAVGWPQCGEIDIMEYRGANPTITIGTLHGPGYAGGNSVGKEYELPNDRFDTDFHVFGVEWGPEYINFYVDDVLFNQLTPEDVPGEWVYNKPFYMLLNLAVGGNFGGPPNENTVFPQTLLVDYVRVYSM